MTKKILYLIMCVIFFSCKHSSNIIDDSGAQTLLFSEVDSGKLKLSSILKSSNFIPLETSDRSLIAGINKLYIHNGQIMILDKTGTKSVMIFDRSGRFIRKIGAQGKGKEEYSMIDDFTFNSDESKFLLLTDQRNVFVFDLHGKYQTRFRLKFSASKIEYSSSSKLLYFIGDEQKQDNLIVADRQGKKLSGYFPNKEMGHHILNLVHPFLYFDSTLIYHRYLDDKIYELDGEKLKVRYKIDFGDKGFTQAMLNENLSLEKDTLRNKLQEFKCHIKYFVESGKLISFIFFYKKNGYIGIYNKQTKTAMTYPIKEYVDDLSGYSLTPLMEYVVNNQLISVLQPMQLIKTESKVIVNDRLMQIRSKITRESNPILWFLSN